MTVTLHSQSWLDSVTSGPAGSAAITLLLLAGACTGLKALARFLYCIYVYFIRPGKNLKRLGQWAAITGATDGIGKAYAFALAKKGLRKPDFKKQDRPPRVACVIPGRRMSFCHPKLKPFSGLLDILQIARTQYQLSLFTCARASARSGLQCLECDELGQPIMEDRQRPRKFACPHSQASTLC